MHMNIRCPHCGEEFRPKEARVRLSRESYKWYEFSSYHSFCPYCDGRFQRDLSKAGVILVLSKVFSAAVIWFAGFQFASAGLFMLLLYVLVRFPATFFRDEAK